MDRGGMRRIEWLARLSLVVLLATVAEGVLCGPALCRADGLSAEFASPPATARPRTWWHWTGGNITKEGITKDLEWMHRVGIAGFQLADVSFGGGQAIETKVEFGTPEWLAMVRHAASEAERLGLEMAVFSSPGWSLAGGPWVKPEEAMKKLVWSEMVVKGPTAFHGRLPQPPSRNGPIRNLGRADGRDPTFYGDSAVVAFRTPIAEQSVSDLKPKVTTTAGIIDPVALLDDDLNTSVSVPAGDDGIAWVQFEFAEPFTARAITLSGPRGIPVGRILAGDDGGDFRVLATLPGAQLYRQGQVRTFAFPKTTARVYRVEMTAAPLGPAQTMRQAATPPAKSYVLREAVLHAAPRVDRWEDKAGFSFLFEYVSVPTPEVAAEEVVQASDVVDLTSRMQPDGTLDWDVPAGNWVILRLGYSLTGAKNRPATAAGLGYEVDKLSHKHVTEYYHGYIEPLRAALGPLFGKSLRYVLLDSWEAGKQNWTEDMLVEFRRRRGYDPLPYLPVLTGRVVGRAEVSDRFLWDFRRTIADLVADNFYGTMDELLAADGLGSYSEASGVSLEIPEDTLLNKSKVDIPMGEFWFHDLHPRLMYYQDVRGAASAAHAYGKPIVAAESFTGGGYESPFALMKVANYWMAQGINLIVFHTSAHQPLDTKPGNVMVGTHLHRNITWGEQAAPFVDYLSRASLMLQQGLFVADVAYLLPEGAPSTMPIWGAGLTPPPPAGYDYDYINADVLLHRMTVAGDGRLMLPDGMSYRLLVLPETRAMRPELVEKLQELVAGGATILGPRPEASPSLAGFPSCDERVRRLAADLWGDTDGRSRTIHRVGKGQVVWGLPPADVLARLGVGKDFECSTDLDADVAWLHRRSGDVDIYYVASLADRPRSIDARFRAPGKAAQIWHPDTGRRTAAESHHEGDFTRVALNLQQQELVFVVFGDATDAVSQPASVEATKTLAVIEGPWQVTFPPKLGAPEHIELANLASLTEHPESGVKYFSGTATYFKTLTAPAEWFADNQSLQLDLGDVYDLAEVTINGKPLGIAWKPPYRYDVTQALKPGDNQLEIRVTNEWTNRIRGDATLDESQRVLAPRASGRRRFGPRRGELSPAGLVGPVTIESQRRD